MNIRDRIDHRIFVLLFYIATSLATNRVAADESARVLGCRASKELTMAGKDLKFVVTSVHCIYRGSKYNSSCHNLH